MVDWPLLLKFSSFYLRADIDTSLLSIPVVEIPSARPGI
jgi:hypothetical protein